MNDDLPSPNESPPESKGTDKSKELLDTLQSLGDHRILLVVDRGLIQFGKFILAQVAIFGIIGVFFFGADIKDALKEVRKTREELIDIREDLDDAKKRLKTDQEEFREELIQARKSVDGLQEQVADLKQQADIHLSHIRGLRTEAERHVVVMKELTVSERTTLAQVTKSEFKNIARVKNLPDTATEEQVKQAETLQLWTNGSTLRVRFLDGTKEEQDEVKRIANEWTNYANIHFDFVEAGVSHIRITLRPKNFETPWPAWSYQGTASLGIGQSQPSMAIDIANELKMFDFSDEKVRQGAVLRQFGFALGLIDETRNPNARIPWDYEAMQPYDRRRTTIYSELELPGYRNFDPESVMFSSVFKTMTKDNFELIRYNFQLSESDKQLIANLYPD